MTEHKFTFEEIMQHMLAYADRKCDSCEVFPTCCNCCVIAIIKAGVDLINRQKAELEDLRQIVFTDRSEAIKNIKAEAVKEFADELISETRVMQMLENGAIYRAVTDGQIEKISKAMIGETK